MDPIFSILLPTHSRPDVISYAIASVLRQREANFELLVVGDGATEQTARVVTSFSDERVKWFDMQKASGFGYANRNRVLAAARGRYVSFMSDDDLLFSDHLSRLRKRLDEGAVLACTRAAWVSTDGIAAPFPVSLQMPDELWHFLNRANVAPSSCFGYRREVLEGGPPLQEDLEVAADWFLWRRLLAENPTKPLGADSGFTVMHFAAKRKASLNSRTKCNTPDLI